MFFHLNLQNFWGTSNINLIRGAIIYRFCRVFQFVINFQIWSIQLQLIFRAPIWLWRLQLLCCHTVSSIFHWVWDLSIYTNTLMQLWGRRWEFEIGRGIKKKSRMLFRWRFDIAHEVFQLAGTALTANFRQATRKLNRLTWRTWEVASLSLSLLFPVEDHTLFVATLPSW